MYFELACFRYEDHFLTMSTAQSNTWYTQPDRRPHYENTPIQIYWKFYFQKTENFQIKISDIFHISAQNIDCGYSLEPPRRGGSNEYPQSVFFNRNKKIRYTPVNPRFTPGLQYKSGV